MQSIPVHKLSNGEEMPVAGFGTWDLKGNVLKESLKLALDKGYTHIDTAEGYQNEKEVGEVLENYSREDLFLTTKILPSNLHYEDVIEGCHRSLNRLNTSYLDLYLIHWPNPAISLRETLFAFKKLYEQGLVKSIGVSNFSIYQLKVALKIAEIPLTVNQVEFHPWYYQKELLQFCLENNIVVSAAAPLARTKVLNDELIKKLADKYNKTSAQIVLRWEVEKGVVPLPKSSSETHIEDNLALFDWELNSDDIKEIDSIARNEKIYQLSVDDNIYGIN